MTLRVRRCASVFLALLAVGVAPVVAAPSAHAAAFGEQINAYDVDIRINEDSSLQVRETIAYNFGTASGRHGIFRVIPMADYYDDVYDRVIKIDDVEVSSPTGAPTGVSVERSGGVERIRIGDEDRTIGGQQTYVISYTVRGAMNAFEDTDELVWNAIGVDWDVPIVRATTDVAAPGDINRVRCTTGVALSQEPCDAAVVTGAQARFTQRDLGQGRGMTVSVELPKGTVTVAPPILEARWTFARAFSVYPLALLAAIAMLVLGVGGVLLLGWRTGRDRRFVGEVPGLEPPVGAMSREEPRPLGTGPEGAVEFAPPPGARPGTMGTLLDERADIVDVTATVIDLAVRGYLRIEEIPKEGWFGKADWRIVALTPADDKLLPYERRLLNAFTGRTDNRLSVVAKDAALDLQLVQQDLYNEVIARGWFRGRPDRVRTMWLVLGALLTGAGVAATFALARWTTYGWTGIALVIAGVVLMLSAKRMPARTGRGSAMLARSLGFRTYIRTAEVEQIKFEEREQVFSRYLPYAMAFGEVERWTKAFAAVGFGAAAGAAAGSAAAGNVPVYLPWYAMASGSSFSDLTSAIDNFTVTTTGSLSAAAAAASASSGGSGFGGGGGFSGGGFGGGGGGSW